MALTNPTSSVTANLTITLADLLSPGATVLNRIAPVVAFKSLNVQYSGYVTLPISTNTTFSPVTPALTFGVVYIRNTGPGNIEVLYANTGGALTNNFNLDPGAMFLYVSPALSSVQVGVSSGIASFQVLTSATTTSIIEILAAG